MTISFNSGEQRRTKREAENEPSEMPIVSATNATPSFHKDNITDKIDYLENLTFHQSKLITHLQWSQQNLFTLFRQIRPASMADRETFQKILSKISKLKINTSPVQISRLVKAHQKQQNLTDLFSLQFDEIQNRQENFTKQLEIFQSKFFQDFRILHLHSLAQYNFSKEQQKTSLEKIQKNFQETIVNLSLHNHNVTSTMKSDFADDFRTLTMHFSAMFNLTVQNSKEIQSQSEFFQQQINELTHLLQVPNFYIKEIKQLAQVTKQVELIYNRTNLFLSNQTVIQKSITKLTDQLQNFQSKFSSLEKSVLDHVNESSFSTVTKSESLNQKKEILNFVKAEFEENDEKIFILAKQIEDKDLRIRRLEQSLNEIKQMAQQTLTHKSLATKQPGGNGFWDFLVGLTKVGTNAIKLVSGTKDALLTAVGTTITSIGNPIIGDVVGTVLPSAAAGFLATKLIPSSKKTRKDRPRSNSLRPTKGNDKKLNRQCRSLTCSGTSCDNFISYSNFRKFLSECY